MKNILIFFFLIKLERPEKSDYSHHKDLSTDSFYHVIIKFENPLKSGILPIISKNQIDNHYFSFYIRFSKFA